MHPFPFIDLLDWYEKNGRHSLPWRQYFHLSQKDIGYHVWLAEILLQQTQVSRVIPFFEKILVAFPHIENLTNTTFEEFFPYYKGLGYYSRAKNLLATAKKVVEIYNGTFPEDEKELLNLPGIGLYTAKAIQAFAYNKPVLAPDTNVKRVFARFYFGTKNADLPANLMKQLEKELAEFSSSGTCFSIGDTEMNSAGRDINAALMDFAAATANKDSIDWNAYPLKNCAFFLSRGEKEGIQKLKAQTFPTKHSKIIVFLHQDHLNYFSENPDQYRPFFLPEADKKDIRHHIQDYFHKKYHLEVSVRPIHERFIKSGIPHIVCNAQIQTGKNPFSVYTKNDKTSFWRDFLIQK